MKYTKQTEYTVCCAICGFCDTILDNAPVVLSFKTPIHYFKSLGWTDDNFCPDCVNALKVEKEDADFLYAKVVTFPKFRALANKQAPESKDKDYPFVYLNLYLVYRESEKHFAIHTKFGVLDFTPDYVLLVSPTNKLKLRLKK